jgi:hypothetical protein
VLTNLNITQLDDKYFIERWRNKERKQLKRHNAVPQLDIEKSISLRHNILSNKLEVFSILSVDSPAAPVGPSTT